MINWNYFNYYKINFTLNRFVKTFSHQFNYIFSPNRKFLNETKKKLMEKKQNVTKTRLSRNAIIFVIMAVTWQGMMNGLQLLIYGVSGLEWNASFFLREWKRFFLYGIQYAQTALETFRLSSRLSAILFHGDKTLFNALNNLCNYLNCICIPI